MKRDVDLARQLLLEVEAHGGECPLASLRLTPATEVDERLRRHVRLLVDAGLLKDAEQAPGGAPSVRLTHAGYEFVELAHHEGVWRWAKWVVHRRTGGLPLGVLRVVLARWATEAALADRPLDPPAVHWTEAARPYATRYSAPRRRYVPDVYESRLPYAGPYAAGAFAPEPLYDAPVVRYTRRRPAAVESAYATAAPWWSDSPYARRRPDYLERFDWRMPLDWRQRTDREVYAREVYAGPDSEGVAEDVYDVSLPLNVV